MNERDTIRDNDYLDLRKHSRQALAKIGIESNPGFTDYNIIRLLREQQGLATIQTWDENDDGVVRFRDSLADTLGIEKPFSVGDITLKLSTLRA